MNHLQNQSYNLWFNFLADKIMEWRDAKPLNSDLKNCIKGMNEVGQYVNQLRVENQVLVKRISMIRNDKNEIIQSYKQQIQELENKLKQYNMDYIDEADEITRCWHCDNETDGESYCSKTCKDYDLE